MNGKCFLDTNVLVYAHDRTAGLKHEKARDLAQHLWQSGQGVLSTQVLQELCVTLRRMRPLDDIRNLLQDYLSWQIVVNEAEAILEAMEIELRYRISFWDALIIQAAENGSCATLYSEDFRHGQMYGSVRVINPFSPEALIE